MGRGIEVDIFEVSPDRGFSVTQGRLLDLCGKSRIRRFESVANQTSITKRVIAQGEQR